LLSLNPSFTLLIGFLWDPSPHPLSSSTDDLGGDPSAES
jgi:hypothetical protein